MLRAAPGNVTVGGRIIGRLKSFTHGLTVYEGTPGQDAYGRVARELRDAGECDKHALRGTPVTGNASR